MNRLPLRVSASNLEIAKVEDAGFHHVEIHFDEVILDAARLCRSEDFLPVESALSHWHDFLGSGGPTLDVHGEKAAGVFHEILSGVEPFADGRNLELEIDELGIEKADQDVVSSFAVNR
jgi:hypothetical protein